MKSVENRFVVSNILNMTLLQMLFLSRTTRLDCLRNLPQGLFTDVIVKVVEKTDDFRIFLEFIIAEKPITLW